MANQFALADWKIVKSHAGEYAAPTEIPNWQNAIPAKIPATLANSLRVNGEDNLAQLDHYDWWYQCDLSSAQDNINAFAYLALDGLAGMGEIWLNGEKIAEFSNMFLPYHLDLKPLLSARNELTIVFRSVHAFLSTKRARPAWRTNLVENQNLRWLRSTLLGYIPSWTPDIKPIGFWQKAALITWRQKLLSAVSLCPYFKNNETRIRLYAETSLPDLNEKELELNLNLEIAGQTFPLSVEKGENTLIRLSADLAVENVALWWPHTHGKPQLYEWSLSFSGNDSVSRKGKIGFKSIELNREKGEVGIKINGKSVFCRGSCWTCSDIVKLTESREHLKNKLEKFVSANMNMLRIGGTMLYEHDQFYELCDELGILVWQDFMFANMDYPFADEAFLASAKEETTFQARRLARFASLSVFCGGSELEQQAAMMAMPPEKWRNDFFTVTLKSICQDAHEAIPYFSSSPCEGDLPFYSSVGIAHYFGVGAYKRDLSDLMHSKVKFAGECLAFSNIPSEKLLRQEYNSLNPPTHTPEWKAGVPRDNTAGWDFEDIRDHYCKQLFGIDPISLRYSKLERYLSLAAVTTGYLMSKSFLYWRSAESQCGGALTWFYNDIVPGAGWGLMDSAGESKPAMNILKQALKAQQCSVENKGLEGHRIRVINESPNDLVGQLKVTLLGKQKVIRELECAVELEAFAECHISLTELNGGFIDSTYCYRFGPEIFDCVLAELYANDGVRLSQDADFPLLIPFESQIDVIESDYALVRQNESEHLFSISVDRALYFVSLKSEAMHVIDGPLHLLPGKPNTFRVSLSIGADKLKPVKKIRAMLHAVNMSEDLRVVLDL